MEEANDIRNLRYTTTETGRALLAAMCEEEPFRTLSEIPAKLQSLRTITERKEVGKVRYLHNTADFPSDFGTSSPEAARQQSGH